MKVLSLCDLSGNMVRPWAEAGHDCSIVDIRHGDTIEFVGRGHIIKHGLDVLNGISELLEEKPDIVFSSPPCTNGAVSGARWWKDKGIKGLIKWLEIFEACREICESEDRPWLIEQPVIDKAVSTRWRKPDFSFNPYDYGGYCTSDAYTKKTQIWCGGGLVWPTRKPIPVCPDTGDRIHTASPRKGRSDFRSRTPMGFARAVFEANSKKS